MGKTLIVAEKPNAGRDIFAAIEKSDISKSRSYQEGARYVVTWGFGHLAGFVEPEVYGAGWKEWDLAVLPMVPQEWRVEPVGENAEGVRGAKAQLEQIKKLASRKDVDRIVIATDAEREGELIFHFIEMFTGINRLGKPILRLWTQGQTEDAIREAMSEIKPRDAFRGFLEAGLCRAKADWILGLSGTRAATVVMRADAAKRHVRVVGKEAWSVGRVQTPVVALVVDRFRENKNFKPKEYFRVRGEFAKGDGSTFDGLWFRGDQKTLETEKEASEIAKRAKAGPVSVVSADAKPKKVPPQILYNQNSIQKDGNKRFGFPLEKTLAICQKLYERKLISYPRSPSSVLPPGMLPELWMHLEAFDPEGPYGAAAAKAKLRDPKSLGTRFVKASEAAHYALIPIPRRKWEDEKDDGDDQDGPIAGVGTAKKRPVPVEMMRQDISHLSDDERAIYDMVTRRFLAMLWPDAVESHTTVIVSAGGETFRTSGTVVVDPGWYEVDPPPAKAKAKAKKGKKAVEEEPSEDAEEGGIGDEDQGKLPVLTAGEALKGEFNPEADRTSPPPLYTEGTLVDAMRTAGKDLDEAMTEAMAADGKDGGIGTTATRAATIKELFGKKYIAKKGQKIIPTDKAFALIDFLRECGAGAITSAELTGEWEMALQEVQAGRKDPEEWFRDFLAFAVKMINALKERFDPAFAQTRAKGVDIGECPKCKKGHLQRYPSDYGGFYATCNGCKAAAGVDEAGALILRETPCVFCGQVLVSAGKFGDYCMGCGEAQGSPTQLVCPVCSKPMIGLLYQGKAYVRCTGQGCSVSWSTDSGFHAPSHGFCGCGSPLHFVAKPTKGIFCVKCGKPGERKTAKAITCPKCGSSMRPVSSAKAGAHLRCTSEGCSIWWHTNATYDAPRHGTCQACGSPLRAKADGTTLCVMCG